MVSAKKASEVRTQLSQTLDSVRRTGRDQPICRSGTDPMATLTLVPPSRGTPPMDIGVEAAREGWSQLLELVSVSGARFKFGSRGEPPVYLVRAPAHRNRWARAWREHRQAFREGVGPVEDDAAALIEEFRVSLTDHAASLRRRIDKALKVELEDLLDDAAAQFKAARGLDTSGDDD